MENLFFLQYMRRMRHFSCKLPCRIVKSDKKLLVILGMIVLPTLFSLPAYAGNILHNPVTAPHSIDRTVTGKVTNESGESLTGVTIQLKGSNTTVTTSEGGTFSITVPDADATLIFSYTGMSPQEVKITGSQSLLIVLKADDSTLSDVVVVGYGTQKKINLTGSVATVSSKTLLERPATNAANLLQGRVTGLQVIQPTASPGRDDPQFQIRGLGSFGASSNPLILVDGIIGSITNLNPNDIESVSVLKDAASAAIYGSRAANGVILVTTKRGKKGGNTIGIQD